MVMEGAEEIKHQSESCRILVEVEEGAQLLDRTAAPLLPPPNRQRNNQLLEVTVLWLSVLYLEVVVDLVTGPSSLGEEVAYSTQFRCSYKRTHRLKTEVEITRPEEEVMQLVEVVEAEGDLTEGKVEEDIVPRRVQTHRHRHRRKGKCNAISSSDRLPIFSLLEASSCISCSLIYTFVFTFACVAFDFAFGKGNNSVVTFSTST
jgi:hypothetical protein